MALDVEVLCLVLLAAGMHATWNALVKVSGDPLLTQTAIITTGSALALAIAPFVPAPAPASWPFIAASVAIHNLYFLLLLGAYRHGDFSQVYPIARGSSPLIVGLLSGPLVGETLSGAQLAGVVLVAFGIASLAGVGRSRGVAEGAAVFYALACGLSIGAFSLVDGIGVRRSGSGFSFAVWLTALEFVPIAIYTAVRRSRGVVPFLRVSGRIAAAGGVLAAVSYSLIIWAYTQGPIAPIAALRETSVVMAALIGAVRFGEPFGIRRIAAAVVVVLGVALLNGVW